MPELVRIIAGRGCGTLVSCTMCGHVVDISSLWRSAFYKVKHALIELRELYDLIELIELTNLAIRAIF